MRGPNLWSIRRDKLIVMILDLEEMEEKPSNLIPGFSERLKKFLPTLYEHRCSEGVSGGFFKRVDEGTWMSHIIEHIALEIQTLAGMDTGFGRTRGYGEKGVYNVVFSYEVERVGKYAAKAAVSICEALIEGTEKEYGLDADIQKMRELREKDRFGPSTNSIIIEAESRGIPWIRLDDNSLCQLGYGANQRRIRATVTSETISIGVELACNKGKTRTILKEAQVPVPEGRTMKNKENLKEACEELGYPIVIKPISGNHGRGITTNICTFKEALKAFRQAKSISEKVVVERFIPGVDYRLLVINNKFTAAARRNPAQVTGDGKLTIRQLVGELNSDPRRGYGHEKVLTQITINNLTKSILEKKGLTENSVPKMGEKVILKDTANLSTGGTSDDVTDIVHPEIVAMAERISMIIDLDICGIDVMTSDISRPLYETGGAVLEVNAAPGFRMHLFPTSGLPRNVAAPVVDKLFPEKGKTGRIPIVAVTGTNGKTTTVRLIAHMAKMSGSRVGYTTSDGIYIQNRMLVDGDCTGPVSAQFVLKDPTVNFAALECARGGILRAGLGFKKCNVGIVANVADDHLGIDGIHTTEQLARVKGVVAETVMPDGYAVLNAEDDLVYSMRDNLKCKIALFAMDEDNPRIKALQMLGGITAVYENGYVTLCRGGWKMRIMKAEDIPLTFEGKAYFMIQNILPAIITGYVQGFSLEDIRAALHTFVPTPTQIPGRMNMFKFNDFNVLVDYAHNPAAMRALKGFTDKIEAARKIGVIGGVGDRRDQDTIGLGKIAAQMFDKIIIRQDQNLRGRTTEEIVDLIEKGIKTTNLKRKVISIPNEREAVIFALNSARKGSLVVVCSDAISSSLKLIKKIKNQEDADKRIIGVA